MSDLYSWFTGGGLIILVLMGGGRYILNKINESFKRIITLEKENAVHDAVQDIKIKHLEDHVYNKNK
jgi:hypothetical protein